MTGKSPSQKDNMERKGSFGNLFSFFSGRKVTLPSDSEDGKAMKINEKLANVIDQSNYISRDLSWLKFNARVLDQARTP